MTPLSSGRTCSGETFLRTLLAQPVRNCKMDLVSSRVHAIAMSGLSMHRWKHLHWSVDCEVEVRKSRQYFAPGKNVRARMHAPPHAHARTHTHVRAHTPARACALSCGRVRTACSTTRHRSVSTPARWRRGSWRCALQRVVTKGAWFSLVVWGRV